MHKIFNTISAALGHPWLPAFAVLLAVVLTLSTLWNGFCLDDNLHRLIFKGDTSLVPKSASPLNLFYFLSGDPEDTRRLMNTGRFSWMTNEKAKVAFFRPLSALSHDLDYMLWPDNPVLMHAQSILWLALLAAGAAVLYRAIMGAGWVAGLAAIFFAIDPGHGVTAGWLANRNSILACLFGVLCLVCHDRWRQTGRSAWACLGPLLFILSLLSAEAGIATAAYLFAYALVLQSGPLKTRLAGLLPYVVIVVVWRAAYTLMGCGAGDLMGFYVDPVHDPLVYLKAICMRTPVYLLGQFAAPPLFFIVFAPRLFLYAGVVFTVLLLCILVPLIQHDRILRFWTAGTLLAILPVCAVNPEDRNLMFVSVGAAVLMAQAFFCFRNKQCRPQSRLWKQAAWLLFGQFFLMHGLLAPMGYLQGNVGIRHMQDAVDQVSATLPSGPESLHRTMVIINNPYSFLFVGNVMTSRALKQQFNPLISLISGKNALAVTRLDAKTLKIVLDQSAFKEMNFYLLDKNSLRHAGDKVELADMSVEVLGEFDGIPSEVLFRFKVPLEDPRFLWLCWGKNGYVPFILPAVGEIVKLKEAVWNFKKADA